MPFDRTEIVAEMKLTRRLDPGQAPARRRLFFVRGLHAAHNTASGLLVTLFSLLGLGQALLAQGGSSVRLDPAAEREARASWLAPLLQGHSHNDYLRNRPLTDALEQGFFSVEADVVLDDRKGALVVAHEHASKRPDRTLEALYLEPLAARARRGGGRVYRGGPLGFRLLIDCKDPPAQVWPVLEKTLSRYRDCLTSWTDGVKTERAVSVILSGRAPRDRVAKLETRWCALDGGIDDADASLFPLCSEPWTRRFRWNGSGSMPEAERAELRRVLLRVHAQGRRMRFWRLPAKVECWRVVQDAGLDVLHTDDVRGLGAFLRERRAPVPPAPWKPLAFERVEASIDAWTYRTQDPPLQAFLVRADLGDPRVSARPVLAGNPRHEQTCSAMAAASGAFALINAGFFFWEKQGLAPNGALVVGGKILARPKTHVENKRGQRFDLARAALLFYDARMPALAWLGSEPDGSLVPFASPWNHGATKPVPAPPEARLRADGLVHAIQAGPMLLRRGRNITARSRHGERMFVRDKRHPRTAVGLRGSVLHLLVVDGRQKSSRGATLDELAAMLRALGVTDAINFDGGGSSTMILRGRCLNAASDGAERKIPNALGIFVTQD